MSTIQSSMLEVKGHTYCALTIGEVSGELPRHLLSGEQECGYLYREGSLTELYYARIADRDGLRSILWDTPIFIPVTEIGTRFPDQVKEKILEVSEAMQAVPRSFLQNERGQIPAWRIFLLEGGGVALLPSKLSDLILYSASQEDRNIYLHRFHRPDVHSPFALCHELAQLLYLALAGFAPFEPEEVKQTAYRPIPSSIAIGGLPAESAAALDAILTMPVSAQRTAVSGAYSASENLSWFDEQIRDLSFTLDEKASSEENLAAYRETLKKKGERREFWRKKGVGIIAAALALTIILSVSVRTFIRSLEPPYTAGMTSEEIISEFFAAQNDLDIERMNASLARGVKNPFEQEVTTLFVNSRVRQAYEQVDALLTPEEYENSGSEAIPYTAMIYGVSDLTVTRIGEDAYLATYLYYAPDRSEDTGGEAEVYRGVVAENRVEFTFSDTKGYEQITRINDLGHEIVREFEVPYER